MNTSERVGAQLGSVIAPIFAAVSRIRGARTFHPRGDLARVTVEPIASEDHALKRLGWSLKGKGLIRFSNALFAAKVPVMPDVLGCSLALVDEDGKPDQHLLMATIQRPWTMLLAPMSTNVKDYLANDYFGVSPFSAPGIESLYLSLRREEAGEQQTAEDRQSLFTKEVDAHRSLVLAASTGPRGPWTPVARVTLQERLGEESGAMEFDPFLDGRGLVPHGFIHSLRKSVYAASRKGREQATHVHPQPAGL